MMKWIIFLLLLVLFKALLPKVKHKPKISTQNSNTIKLKTSITAVEGKDEEKATAIKKIDEALKFLGDNGGEGKGDDGGKDGGKQPGNLPISGGARRRTRRRRHHKTKRKRFRRRKTRVKKKHCKKRTQKH